MASKHEDQVDRFRYCDRPDTYNSPLCLQGVQLWKVNHLHTHHQIIRKSLQWFVHHEIHFVCIKAVPI